MTMEKNSNNNKELTTHTRSGSKELTTQNELFLEYLFNDPECQGNTRRACEKAGYEPNYHYNLVSRLADHIVSRAQTQLALNAPKAVQKLINAMDEDKSVPGAELRLKAVESVLDRVGVAKKQQIEMSASDEKPIFFIPAKVDLNVPED